MLGLCLVSSLLVDDVLEFIGDDVLEFIGDDVLEFIGDDVLEFIGDDSSLRAAAGWLSAASLSPLSSRTRRHSGVAAATDAQSVDAGRRQGQGCSTLAADRCLGYDMVAADGCCRSLPMAVADRPAASGGTSSCGHRRPSLARRRGW